MAPGDSPKNSESEIEASETLASEEKPYKRPQTWKECLCSPKTIVRIIIAAILITGAIVALLLLPESPTYYLSYGTEWIHGLGWYGWIAFAGLYALTNVLFIPGFALNIAAGYAWDIWLGSLLVWIGSMGGAAASFFVGRYFFKEWSSFCTGRYENMDILATVIRRKSLKIIFLLRLSPVMPYNILNYTLSMIPELKFWHYMAATSIGTTPGIFVFVYLGTILEHVQNVESSEIYEIVLIVGFGVTVVVTVIISWVAGREVKKEMAARRIANVDKTDQFGLSEATSPPPPTESTALLQSRV